ncbi:MAG: RNA polymerase sigma factor [Limisphaerales bacterium]
MPAREPIEDAWLVTQGVGNATEFRTTLWTTVLAAGKESSLDSDAALARLCQTYWPPVYAYIRKRVPSPEQAEDLTQGFFARFLEKHYVSRAQRNRGRFRCFLLTSVENFLCDEHDHAMALKRGGGQPLLSLDVALMGEEQEPASPMTPALAFEKRWAQTLLNRVMQRLREEHREGSRAELFERLQSQLWGETSTIPYEELSKRLGMSNVHLRVAAHRMRQRYREILREEIAQTVSGCEEIEDEIRHLLHVVSS